MYIRLGCEIPRQSYLCELKQPRTSFFVIHRIKRVIHGVRSDCKQSTGDLYLVGLAVGLRDPASASAAVVLLHVHLGACGVEVAGRVQPLDHHLLKRAYNFRDYLSV